MVLSAIGYAMAARADHATTMELATLAGGLEVERLGVVPVTRREMLAELAKVSHTTSHKILSIDQLLGELKRLRQAGRRIAMTNGCFDLLHAGHIQYLQASREKGDVLVVGLNSDDSVHRLKGEGRPVIGAEDRAHLLAALACVDYVVVFEEDTPLELIRAVQPHVITKGADYTVETVVGHDEVSRWGGEVVLIPLAEDRSTSRLIDRIVSSRDG